MCEERKIDATDILYILMNGKHMETREYQNKMGRYRESFEGFDLDGHRVLRVVIHEELDILVITAIDL